MWEGDERRSAGSVAARAAVAARMEAAQIEAALARARRGRFANRRRVKELERDLRDIRAVERRCLEALGAGPVGSAR